MHSEVLAKYKNMLGNSFTVALKYIIHDCDCDTEIDTSELSNGIYEFTLVGYNHR